MSHELDGSRFLSDALAAKGPHPSLGDHADTYGRLIGSWAGTVRVHAPDGSNQESSVEIHFAWVLEGRAVQDTWIAPARPERGPDMRAPRNLYGTTLRVFDPEAQDWKVTWFNPLGGTRCDLVGRRQGDDIVQMGLWKGVWIRWTFSEIRPASFLWRGHMLQPDGVTWRLDSEYRVKRT